MKFFSFFRRNEHKKKRIRRRDRVLEKFTFNDAGRVIFVAKALDLEGTPGKELFTDEDNVVIGFVRGMDVYRGIVPANLLSIFPVNNPEYGHSYTFQSKHPIKVRETYSIVKLSDIKPANSICAKYF